MEQKDFECIEDLGNGLSILQSKKLYRFTTDAVLLANFVDQLKGKTAVELCSGSGVISILIAAKKQAKKVVAVEIQSDLAKMSQKSVELNDLCDKIEVVNRPLQNVSKTIGSHFDCVVCNPPYRKVGSGDMQNFDSLAICRHEVKVTLLEVIEEASKLLNSKGSFFLVHQSQRLAEICYLLKTHKIEPKKILPVCSKANSNPNLVLVKGTKDGSVGCVVEKPLVLNS